MSVRDLTRSQLVRLKQEYLADLREGNITWGELAAADDLVCDDEIYLAYANVSFSPDDL